MSTKMTSEDLTQALAAAISGPSYAADWDAICEGYRACAEQPGDNDPEIDKAVKEAVAEARDWLATDPGDDARMTKDLALALNAYNAAIEAGDLAEALRECESISYDWASGDRSGFQALYGLVGLVGEWVSFCDAEEVLVQGYALDAEGRWSVIAG